MVLLSSWKVGCQKRLSVAPSDTVRLLAAAAHEVMAFGRTIMPGAEPLIERHCPITAVVALEISVMEMVEIALADRMGLAVLALPFVVTDMAHGGSQSCRLYVEDCVHGVRQQKPMEQDAAKI